MIRIRDIAVHPGLYSFANDVGRALERLKKGLDVLLLVGDVCTIYSNPEGNVKTTSFVISENDKSFFEECNDYDVVEINVYGLVQKRYSQKDGDCTLYTSAQCNSNCIMCPISEGQRRTEELEEISRLLELIRYLPQDVEHVTITGGEPFLLGNGMFEILSYLKAERPNAQVLLLTNGRVFADKYYAQRYVESRPALCVPGIPIHGSNQRKHDAITRAKGSFEQTILGIKHLIKLGETVEVRIVVSKLNLDDIVGIAEMIVATIPGISSVKMMGLEMLGNAAVHCEDVWIDYMIAMQATERAIDLLLFHGIDVELYNFPLCVVKQKYWGIYRKSIDPYKIRYLKKCDQCDEQKNCGGFFSGTIRMIDDVNPIKNGGVKC